MTESESEVQAVQAKLKDSWSKRDAEGICSIYADIGDNLRLFDLYQPFEDIGAIRAKEKTDNFLALTEGPVFVEYQDPMYFSAGDLVVSRTCCQFNFVMKGEERQTQIRCRSTMVFKKINGNWNCVHQHDSVPNSDVEI